ncbi:TIGR03118 family protein [Nonomuraea sp. NPDC050536]|uniref:TIGR03118 family protein n=1 Tax=Nonomuraea sp. NPDC050536 TaxID=3364366 RepID=UPI0037C7ECEC
MLVRRKSSLVTLCAAALVLSVSTALPAQSSAAAAHRQTRFEEVDLVSDQPGKAQITDPNLVNPWGMSIGKFLWVSDADKDLSTVYSGGGAAGAVHKQGLEVKVAGGPTGQVFNPGHGFVVSTKKGSGPAMFLSATESGTIRGWNPQADPATALLGAKVKGASFKGLTMVWIHGRPFLLAADFLNGRIDVFNSHFRLLPTFRAFRDRGLPPGYAPFNVAAVGGTVFVAYAKRKPGEADEIAGPGRGFVSQFTASGHFLRRFASRGPLNAPWAITVAPRSFGTFAGALLVGNFGDGRINAFDRRSGRFMGPLRRADGSAISVDGLWGLVPGTAANGGRNALWFAAGVDDEKHGLVGLIRPAY